MPDKPRTQLGGAVQNGLTYKGPFICKNCGFDIYDNGSVAVHLYQQYDRGGRLVIHESQWCDDDTKETIAEVAGIRDAG